MPKEASFNRRLARRCDDTGHVCVGLDPDVARIIRCCEPMGWKPGIAEYCRFVIEATSGVIAAMKFNLAFFEEHGSEGLEELERTIDYARTTSGRAIIVLDAKRGDIGNSSSAYARAVFRFDIDATTVSPYMGRESVDPFLTDASKGAFVLCRTSNKGSDVFQDLDVGGNPLYMRVAETVASEWNSSENCGLVVGATQPAEISQVVSVAPELPLLVPGVGFQGGDLAAAVGALTGTRSFLLNSSRSIMYPEGSFRSRDALAAAIRSEAASMAKQISEAKGLSLHEG